MEQLRILQESIGTAERLLYLLEIDKEDMCRCVHGEILAEYLNLTEKTMNIVKKLKDSLCMISASEEK